MKVELEIDHTVSREEIQNWIDEVLKPQNPCVWKAEITDHYCESYCTQGLKRNELEKENAELKAQIEKMKPFLDCEYCKNCDDEIVCPENGKTICEMCENKNKWELAE